jgi:hypothetical protein
MKKYIGIIRKNIARNYLGIIEVEKYKGQEVYLKENDDYNRDEGYKYLGRFPKRNDGRTWYWKRSCFSSIKEIETS